MAYDQILYEDYKKIPFVPSRSEVYDRLKETYELYCQIGGYPKVVETIWRTGYRKGHRANLVKIIGYLYQ